MAGQVFGKESYVPTRLGTSGAFEIVAGTNWCAPF